VASKGPCQLPAPSHRVDEPKHIVFGGLQSEPDVFCDDQSQSSYKLIFFLESEADKGTSIAHLGPVWQGSSSSKNGFGSGSFGGAAFLMRLKPFWKTFGKTASPVGLRW
jgi:hypothetical protein